MLLLKTAQMDPDAKNADRVASELGFFALTIDQAGCYIATRKLSLQRYLRDCEKNRDRLLDKHASTQKSGIH